MYNRIDDFDYQIEKWKDSYIDEEDEVFDSFYDNEYCELGQWRWDRSFDSSHLVGGPYIGCFRCGEKIKILWESDYELDNGRSIWTAPNGSYEMQYDDFVFAITDFLNSFVAAMNKQVESAVKKKWAMVSLDKQRLVKENEERKSEFVQLIEFLRKPCDSTDWNKVLKLYSKMQEELPKKCKQ